MGQAPPWSRSKLQEICHQKKELGTRHFDNLGLRIEEYLAER